MSRPRILTDAQALALVAEGLPLSEIAARAGITPAGARYRLRALGLRAAPEPRRLTVQIGLRLPEEIASRVAEAADAAGVTPSEWVREAVRARLG